MDNTQAKFILRAYRHNGADANDKAFAEALEQARKDPVLAQWLEQEQAFDRAVSARLKAVAPPAELRGMILAGAKATEAKRTSWPRLWGLGLAAGLLVGVGLLSLWPERAMNREVDLIANWVSNDTVRSHPDIEGEAWPKSLQEMLYKSNLPLTKMQLPITLEELRASGCRGTTFDGREVYEICFVRDGKVYHLYVMTRLDDIPREPSVVERNGAATAVWSDARYAYALVSDAGLSAIRAVL